MRFLYGDPDELDRLARTLRLRAETVRRRAEDQVRRAASARWVSDAATAYRDALDRARQDADRAADGLDHAAAVLEAHVQELRELAARIARIERDVSDWFSNTARELKDAVESFVRKATHGDLPWSGWPYTPQSLPPSGDKGWLEVGDFMRRQGVL